MFIYTQAFPFCMIIDGAMDLELGIDRIVSELKGKAAEKGLIARVYERTESVSRRFFYADISKKVTPLNLPLTLVHAEIEVVNKYGPDRCSGQKINARQGLLCFGEYSLQAQNYWNSFRERMEQVANEVRSGSRFPGSFSVPLLRN